MVCALLGRSEDYRLLVALQPAYFCSWLAMAGATIKEIQELAGHKTITMSARYAHLSPDHKLSVIDRIAARATEQPLDQRQERPPARYSHSLRMTLNQLNSIVLLVPGGGSDCRFVVNLNKLMKILNARNYQNAGNAVLEYSTSTRDSLWIFSAPARS